MAADGSVQSKGFFDLYEIHLVRAWYSQISNTGCTLVGNKIVDILEVVGASPVGAAQTTSSCST